ncbi:hypothetical protein [Xanthomonas arboricola]|uniref:hypothetical protein n=1 Tax=Xanthomonas arboricola TaxID=56448 RepID=UPI001290339A|nr:hypothetical protein [Xanthomonas arboricola]
MSFSGDFLKGIQTARKAEVDRAAIRSVLAEYDASLRSETDGVVAIKLESRTERVDDERTDILGAIGMTMRALNPKFNSFTALVVSNVAHSDFAGRVVCRWKESPSGFPCTLRFEGKEITAVDIKGLHRALSELASSSGMGEAVLAALHHVPAIQLSSADEDEDFA